MVNVRQGYTLLELLSVVAVIGILATIIVTHVTQESDSAKVSACYTFKGDIEIQAEIWMHNNGSWPAANLSNIGTDTNYFPEGLPTCPYDGTGYTIDATTGKVIGHVH